MNIFLWIVQAILAVLFAMSGVPKAVQPKEKLAGEYPWMHDFAPATVRFIGVVELLAAIGLIVPAAAGVAPVLTPLAATGLAILMLLGGAVHIRRGERRGIVITAILFVLAVLVTWTRFGPYGW
jgi:uncharacterized membrane protein YphA (DoxX/SURF4 family)